VSAIGLASKLASVHTLAPSGAEIAADPQAALDGLAATCRRAAQEDGADVVILGGLGLAGLADRIADQVPIPVIDNVVAAVRTAEAVASLSARQLTTGAATPIETTALSAPLAALLEGAPPS